MVALGIFAIGFIAVAAIFPAAILIQKNTLNEIHTDRFKENIQALMATRGFDEAKLQATPNMDTSGQFLGSGGSGEALDDWSLNDRSYPSTILLANRRLFWVPVFQDANTASSVPPPAQHTWNVFIFIVQSQPDTTYAKTIGSPDDWANPTDEPETTFITGPAPDFVRVPDLPAVPGVQRIDVTSSGSVVTLGSLTPPLTAKDVFQPGDPFIEYQGTAGGNKHTVIRVGSASDPTLNENQVEIEGTLTTSPTKIWIANRGVLTARPTEPGDRTIVDIIGPLQDPNVRIK
jgi:hypothetical protein